jgi:hypothetical protein
VEIDDETNLIWSIHKIRPHDGNFIAVGIRGIANFGGVEIDGSRTNIFTARGSQWVYGMLQVPQKLLPILSRQ